MLNFNEAKSKIEASLARRRANKEKGVRHPRRVWLISVAMFFAGIMLIFISHYILFKKFTDPNTLNIENIGKKLQTFDRAILENIVEKFQTREISFEQYKDNLPNVIDPSL